MPAQYKRNIASKSGGANYFNRLHTLAKRAPPTSPSFTISGGIARPVKLRPWLSDASTGHKFNPPPQL
jgi:hypothetical protein